jgi:hypothetical protein
LPEYGKTWKYVNAQKEIPAAERINMEKYVNMGAGLWIMAMETSGISLGCWAWRRFCC